jgi:hypothetical protein
MAHWIAVTCGGVAAFIVGLIVGAQMISTPVDSGGAMVAVLIAILFAAVYFAIVLWRRE